MEPSRGKMMKSDNPAPDSYAVGIIFNSIFIYMVAKVPELRTTVNIYLAYLAFSDVGFLTFSTFYYIAILAYSRIKESTPLIDSNVRCSVILGPARLFYLASLGTLTLITVERYLLLCYPLKYHLLDSKRRRRRFLVCVWVLSAVLATGTSLCSDGITKLCIQWPEEGTYND